jgi:glycerol uptake facilitator-like aquaporin
MDQLSEKIKNKSLEFEHEIFKKSLGYIIASFGLVTGLAWNEAIKAAIEIFFPLQKDTLKAKFVYAIVITIVLVFVSLYLSKLLKKSHSDVEKKSSIK